MHHVNKTIFEIHKDMTKNLNVLFFFVFFFLLLPIVVKLKQIPDVDGLSKKNKHKPCGADSFIKHLLVPA